MGESLKFCCADMETHICETDIVQYIDVFDEYGIALPEDNVSFILLEYCPWCGKKLPESKRECWFNRLEEMGFEAPLSCEDIPEEYKTDKWWKNP